MRFTPKVIPSRRGNVGFIQLNNSKALNSLDLDMVRFLNDVLPTYGYPSTSSPSTFTSSSSSEHGDSSSSSPGSSAFKATIFTSNNETRKAFCAGGDMKRIYMAGMGLTKDAKGQDDMNATARKNKQHGYGYRGLETADFLYEEYQLNYKIAMAKSQSNLPQVSIWDGIVMGGGMGISVHGKYRVATENSVFAMPETNIGFYCDVGATYVLPRLLSGSATAVGNYIALTGSRLQSDDLMYSGLATHYIQSKHLESLTDAIIQKSMEEDFHGDCCAAALMSHHEDIHVGKDGGGFLARHRDWIEEAFGKKECMEDIVVALESMKKDGDVNQHSESKSKFAGTTLETLKKMSPTSLKITLESMHRGKKLDNIADCLAMEYRMGQVAVRNWEGTDFYEGIRAALVDKDRKPKWNPSSLEDVTDEIVNSYFGNLGENELVLR